MPRRLPAALTALALALALGLAVGACQAGPTLPDDGRPHVVASFYPLQFAAEQIGGTDVHTTVLTRPGTEPHDFELSPRDLTAMTRATVVLYSGGFQPAIDDGIEQVDPDRVLDVAPVAHLVPFGSTADGSDDHDVTEHSDAEDGHNHDGADPHFWLDPERYADVATAIGERLATADPANAAAYRERTTRFVDALTTLDTEFRAGLASCRTRTLVTSHSAFGYLAARYGFVQHGISGITPESEPSASSLKQISDLVRTEGISTIYQETLVEPQYARTVASSTGARLVTLDPIEGVTDASAGPDYFSIMRANLATLRTGQDCP